ncbi:cupin domain-containing protein [Streptosporangiaceae bacterium NEAU-GS5]|nr:cupin domain-containing protein [Streptosporangiaceae bacterium NEAU-GS5]
MHLLCSEAYVVLEGSGSVMTRTFNGDAETPLEPGHVVWFSPGTVHRLINGGDLRIVVLMQNSGLPEAGDAVFTFPPAVLADPAAYAEAAAAATPEQARARRDLAIEGFHQDFASFAEQAVRLKADRLDDFERRWRDGALAAAEATGVQLTALRKGDLAHLHDAAVTLRTPEPRLGMCGHLQTYPT